MDPQDYSARTDHRPPAAWYQRLNQLGVPLISLGLAPRDAVTLEVRGRTSGKRRRTPILRTAHEGNDYLVALAGQAQWVRNVRAASDRALIRRRGTQQVHLEELPAERRAPVITAYLRRARERSGDASATRQAWSYFGLAPDPDLEDIEAIAPYYPVFRIDYPVRTKAEAGADAAGDRQPVPTPSTGPGPTTDRREAPDVVLLVDQFLPRYDFAVAHAHVVRASAADCYRAVSELDLFRAPLIRTLLVVRALPQRLADARRGRANTGTVPPTARATFRLTDLVGLGWTRLGEIPGSQLVLGQVSQPWRPDAASAAPTVSPGQFTGFDPPGFVKIATSLRVDPYGRASSVITVETRVAVTDDESRRRFRRYWLLVGPFSAVIRRTAMRLLAADLRRPAPGQPGGPGGLGGAP